MMDSGPYQVGSKVGDVVALCSTREPNRITEQITDLDEHGQSGVPSATWGPDIDQGKYGRS